MGYLRSVEVGRPNTALGMLARLSKLCHNKFKNIFELSLQAPVDQLDFVLDGA